MTETRDELAEDRTEYAEDRTLLANERTFSGWVRTALGAIGVGLGFHVLFGTMEPLWLPKTIATLFILLGCLLVIMAEHRAAALEQRLKAHSIKTLPLMNLRLITLAICSGALALMVAIWFLV